MSKRSSPGAVHRPPPPPLGVHYADSSKQLWISLMFILPIMGLYELSIALSEPGQNNAVVCALKLPLALMGKEWLQVFNATLIVVFFWIGCRHEEDGYPVTVRLFVCMAIESAAWGVVLSAATLLPLRTLWPGSMSAPFCTREFVGITLSVGAGMYEELLFRHLLLGQVVQYLRHNRRWRGRMETLAVVLSLVASSVIFSAMHYVGQPGDTFGMTSFLFRCGGGMALGLIYLTRGLGIAVYAHATYDVLLVVGLV